MPPRTSRRTFGFSKIAWWNSVIIQLELISRSEAWGVICDNGNANSYCAALPESENESSDTEAAKTVAVESSAKKRGRPKKTPSVSEEEKEVLAVEEDENQDEEEEEEENEEDVYVSSRRAGGFHI